MAVVKWESPGAWIDAFNTADFNALANGAGKTSTAAVVGNGSLRELYADISFVTVTSTFTPVVGGHLAFYLLPELHTAGVYPNAADGTNAATQAQLSNFVGAISFGNTALAHSGMLRGIVLPPGNFRLYVINRCGVALPSSSSNMSAKIRLYGEEAV